MEPPVRCVPEVLAAVVRAPVLSDQARDLVLTERTVALALLELVGIRPARCSGLLHIECQLSGHELWVM